MGCVLGSLASCCACSAASCCVSATCSCCGKVVACKKSSATRGIYVFQFLLVSLVAYIFSNWAKDWLKHVPVLNKCPDDSTCYGALSVYRITFGLVLYHAALGLFTIGVSSSADWRSQVQDGWWPLKFLALVGITIGAFFIPNGFFEVYGWIMVVGAAIFIVLQLILLVEFAYQWNESWLLKMEDEEENGGSGWYYLLLGCTMVMICASIALTGVMYKFFASCDKNTFFITINLIVCLIICVLSLHPKVREGRPSSGLLQSAVVMIYSTYLVWSAIMSEPETKCNPLSWSHGTKVVSLIMGAAFTIISVVYSTIRTASASSDLLGTTADSPSTDIEKTPLVSSTDGDATTDAAPAIEDDEADSTTYNYTHFHLTFALGAMYICMLLTNWMTISRKDDDTVMVDRGYVSVWVKIVSSWVTILLYGWTLVAPVVLPDRDWS